MPGGPPQTQVTGSSSSTSRVAEARGSARLDRPRADSRRPPVASRAPSVSSRPVCRSLQAQHAGRVGRAGHRAGRPAPECLRGALGPGRSCQGAGCTGEAGTQRQAAGHARLPGQGGRLALGRELRATPGSRRPDSRIVVRGARRACGRHRGVQGAGDPAALRRRRHQGGEAARRARRAAPGQPSGASTCASTSSRRPFAQACQRRREHRTTQRADLARAGRASTVNLNPTPSGPYGGRGQARCRRPPAPGRHAGGSRWRSPVGCIAGLLRGVHAACRMRCWCHVPEPLDVEVGEEARRSSTRRSEASRVA